MTHPELLEQLGVTGILAPIDGERLSVVETLDRVPGLGGDLFGEGVARGLELFGVSEVDAVIFGKVGGFVVSILLGRMVAPLALAAEGISVALVIVTGGDLQTAIVRRLIVRTVLSTL